MRRSRLKGPLKEKSKGEVKVINKLLLAYLIGLVVTSTLIFIFSEEKVTYRLFAAIITGLTSPLSLIPSIISLMIRKSD